MFHSQTPFKSAQPSAELLFQVTSRTFVAGVVVQNDRVVACAPILRRHLMGLDGRAFAQRCAAKGWSYEKVHVSD